MKTRGGWSETSTHKHTGAANGDPIEVGVVTVRETSSEAAPRAGRRCPAASARSRAAGLPQPGCGWCISPWVDLEAIGETMATRAAADPTVQKAGILDVARLYLNGADPRELGRVGRLKRFLAPQLAELVVSQGDEKILESHRRDIVVVFCDLRGYTAFTETAEPEEVLDLLREYHRALGPLVSQFEGTLDQFSGDGIMVFFNDPVPCPDPAERAVKMAMAMREAAGTLIASWRRRGRHPAFLQLQRGLVEAGFTWSTSEAEELLAALRATYEPLLDGLASYLVLPLQGWSTSDAARDHWARGPRGTLARRLIEARGRKKPSKRRRPLRIDIKEAVAGGRAASTTTPAQNHLSGPNPLRSL